MLERRVPWAVHGEFFNAGHFGLSDREVVTVYPSDKARAVTLAVKLDDVTRGHRGPAPSGLPKESVISLSLHELGIRSR